MKKLSIFFTLLFAFGICQSFAQSQFFTNKIGVQAYTYRNSWANGIIRVLDSVKALGITEMEGPNPKGISPEEFKKLLNERGILMPSIGVDYGLISKDPYQVVSLAKTFGATFVMVAWIPHGNTFTIDDAKKAVDEFNREGKILKDNGITLCYHDHGYEFGPYGDGTLLDYIIQNTNPDYVSFEMDIMWTFHGGGDPAKLLYKYPTRWKMLHLKDIRKGVANDLTGGTSTNNDVALGTGQLDIPGILKVAKSVGIQHYFIEDESPNHASQIPVTIGYIKGLTE
ncbi:sugar phosphate isomerase/epimerase [uncultured Mucilaginibacter sp.]|uniref:sugar phosphate isomerase/epimerase family protein n=1 Tax=uncultured Mucilaginibacter sp. TaxID=797541 RepID=UPI0025D89171|nr:sugar phosphate isomerase/epimerase [uncultured Mucilaginibacter sp.]